MRLRLAAGAAAVAFSVAVLASPDDPVPLPEPEVPAVEVLAEDLEAPSAVAVHGDRAFVTERAGLVRVVQDGSLLEAPLASFRPAAVPGGGLLGIALDPEFAENGRLYLYMTYEEGGDLYNRIMAVTESGSRLRDVETILDGIPGSAYTNGGFLKFGPDGMLYAGTGTVSEGSHLPSDPASLAGKILRIGADGSIPADNPFPGSPVYSLGYRNPQGLAWDEEGRMYAADLGPEKNDEINLVRAGSDHGWPGTECAAGPGTEAALACYDPSIEPGGMIHYSGRIDVGFPLLVASLKASNLYGVDPWSGSESPVLGFNGRVRDVAQGDDGSIYVITSNTDGRGFPDAGDDRLLRITR
ncbi:MAG: PQQ-dependent sugar dehydrogenase [Nitrosopumilus sp.]|nr:PQQ-dependent sugar dehydrogenase [Nitrosopumilus sp.]MDA7959827.1 PQQ-dependent sugar dehydrogenase [Nitrosopumilus sp.]MDA7999138.1 PQQ-dependent sugar dehydrogenase [Nitrosopumilus sp.]